MAGRLLDGMREGSRRFFQACSFDAAISLTGARCTFHASSVNADAQKSSEMEYKRASMKRIWHAIACTRCPCGESWDSWRCVATWWMTRGMSTQLPDEWHFHQQLKLSCCRLGSAERAHVSYLGGAHDPHHRRHSPTLVLSHLRTGHACDWQLIERLRVGHAPLERVRNGPRSAPAAVAALQQPNRSTAPSASTDIDDGHRRRGDATPGRFPSPRTE